MEALLNLPRHNINWDELEDEDTFDMFEKAYLSGMIAVLVNHTKKNFIFIYEKEFLKSIIKCIKYHRRYDTSWTMTDDYEVIDTVNNELYLDYDEYESYRRIFMSEEIEYFENQTYYRDKNRYLKFKHLIKANA